MLLRRSIAPRRSNEYDPFLLFDHFAFNDPIEGPIRGFPMHPHRGIETVTYMLEGSVNHRDSLGNAGLISEGDVQEYARARMARYKAPKYVFFVDTFPMTASGKIQKYKLRDMAAEALGLADVKVFASDAETT